MAHDATSSMGAAVPIKEFLELKVCLARVETLQTEQGKKLDALHQDLKNVYVTKIEHQNLKDDVKALQRNQSWVVRTIVGAVLTAVLGLVVVGKVKGLI